MIPKPPPDEFDNLKSLLLPVMKAIATTIGPMCEVALHDLRRLPLEGSTIVWIEHGHVTGRSVGGPTTNLGLEALRGDDPNPDRYDYRTLLKDGRVLRSSSIYFRGTDRQLLAALCINLDISSFATARAAIETLVGGTSSIGEGPPMSPVTEGEIFGTNVDDVIDGIIASAAATIGKPLAELTRSERVEFVRILDQKGAFQLKKSVDNLSTVLGVSRATLYAYLDEARKSGNDPETKANGHSDVPPGGARRIAHRARQCPAALVQGDWANQAGKQA
jgi:predicted transcriptional regulator YheO